MELAGEYGARDIAAGSAGPKLPGGPLAEGSLCTASPEGLQPLH